QMLVALLALFDRPMEIALFPGSSPEELETVLQAVRGAFLPGAVVTAPGAEARARWEKVMPWIAGKGASADRVTAFLCEGFTCRAPLVGPEAIVSALSEKNA